MAWDTGPPSCSDVATRERLRTAAALARIAPIRPPILVTGGSLESPSATLEGWPGGDVALAEVTADALEKEFSLTPRWVEAGSQTTWENVAFGAYVPRREHHFCLVVTHDSHER